MIGEKFRFAHPLKVRYAETDAQGHVFFANYYIYFDEGLLEYMKAIGYAYQDLLDDGMDLLYVESKCQHYAAARFDDLLDVHVRIGSIGNSSITFDFSIHKQDPDQPVSSGHIVAVNVDKDTHRPVPVPQALRRAVEEYEN
jgi:acyl-CoA thioester hydrolase